MLDTSSGKHNFLLSLTTNKQKEMLARSSLHPMNVARLSGPLRSLSTTPFRFANSATQGYPESGTPSQQDVQHEKEHNLKDLSKKSAVGTQEGVHFQMTPPFQQKGSGSGLEINNKPLGDYLLTHPVYTDEELKSVKILEFEKKSFSDKFANALVKMMRTSFDLVTGYKHKELTPEVKDKPLDWLISKGYVLSEKQWLRRFIFLESVAGCPGFVS